MTHILQGRSAIITGANQGLGKVIAQAYVEAGANVLVAGSAVFGGPKSISENVAAFQAALSSPQTPH